jgi:hypothetical protein
MKKIIMSMLICSLAFSSQIKAEKKCCGGQEYDSDNQFCCNEQVHDKNPDERELSADITYILEIMENLANAFPGDNITYSSPGDLSVSYTESSEWQCCEDGPQKATQYGGSLSVGLGSIRGELPLISLIPGVTEAGIYLSLEADMSASVSAQTESECEAKACMEGSITGTASGGLYADIISDLVSVSGGLNNSVTGSASFCINEDGDLDDEEASACLEPSISYEVTLLFVSYSGTLVLDQICNT